MHHKCEGEVDSMDYVAFFFLFDFTIQYWNVSSLIAAKILAILIVYQTAVLHCYKTPLPRTKKPVIFLVQPPFSCKYFITF